MRQLWAPAQGVRDEMLRRYPFMREFAASTRSGDADTLFGKGVEGGQKKLPAGDAEPQEE